MKLFKKISIFILLLTAGLFSGFSFHRSSAALAPVDNIVAPGWVLFIKKMGDEKFMVRFPVDPSEEINGGALILKAGEAAASYSLTVLPSTAENREMILSRFSGYRLLDMESIPTGQLYHFQRKSFKPRMITILVTPQNIYCMATCSKDMPEARHDFFSQSLVIVP